MRPHILGLADGGRPALPNPRRLMSALVAMVLGIVALASTAPGATAAVAAETTDVPSVVALSRPAVYNDPPKVGELAFAHPGVWSPEPDSVTFTWYRSGSLDPIGTGNPVWIPFEALGQTLSVKVTAKKAGFADGTSTSLPSKAVVPGPPTNYAKPVVYGDPAVGNTVAAWPGVWSVEPDGYAYRWFQEGKSTPIATTEQLVVPADAVGKKLTVEVTVKKMGYEDGVATSDPVTAYDASSQPVENDVKPKISANPTVGSLAVAHPGVWTPEPDSVTAQWYASDSTEPIGTGLTIVVPAGALGKQLTVKVTATKQGRVDGVAFSAPSAAVTAGKLTNGEKPAIFGSPVVGNTVEAWPGTWSATPDSYTYRWLVAGSSQPVGTAKQLEVPPSAAGKQLTVEVTAKKSAHTDGVASSDAVVAQEAATAPTNSSAPVIGGDLVVGGTATASAGTWSPTPDSTHITWFRSGSDQPIGMGETLAPIPADAEGETLQVVVVAKVSGRPDGIAYSAPKGPVAPAGTSGSVKNLAPPQITADPKVGEPVGAHPGVWNQSDVDVTLTWFRAGSTEPIGTGTVIIVPPEAADQRLMVKAVATKSGYASGEATSAPSDVVAKGTLKADVPPKVYGTVTPGATVAAYEGFWPAGPDSVSYRWLVDGSPLAGMTGKELVVPAGSAGKKLSVEVTAKKAGYADAAAVSAPVTVLAAAQSPACGAASGALATASATQAAATAALVQAEAKVTKLKAKKKAAKKLGMKAKVAKLKVKLKKAKAAVAAAKADLATADANLAAAQAKYTASC